MKTPDELIDQLLTLAFAEDVGDGDATTLSTIPADEMGAQHLLVDIGRCRDRPQGV